MLQGNLTGRTLRGFVLGERIVEGGNGVVYRARQLEPRRDVIVKVIRAQHLHNSVARERFLREARLAQLLDHPYAAHIYACGAEDSGLLWIAMERVHGITLGEWLAKRGPMPLDQLVPFVERVAEVVHAAHQHGIVHRDLKTSNIMVVENSGKLLPKLLDFGIAKVPAEIAIPQPLLSDAAKAQIAHVRAARPDGPSTNTDGGGDAAPEHITKPGACIGSSAYMSPEQWQDAMSVGPTSDIYSLGVVIYRALTGKELFTGAVANDLYHQHLNTPPPLIGGDLAAVDRVLARALAKAPADRHATAIELADDLRAALRATDLEQVRTAAQQWDDRKRSPGLLWGREELSDLDRWARQAPGPLTSSECDWVTRSHRRARRAVTLRRALPVAVLAIALAGFGYHALMRARIAEAAVAQAELEQGRSALLHGEPEALAHLATAYAHDHAPSTAFMLARAMQPKLADLARLPSAKGRTWSASFSPDGRRIVTSDDDMAQVWDAQTYHLLFQLPHGDSVYQAAYASDGATIVTACGDSTVRLWDAKTGALVRSLKHDGKPLRYGAVSSANQLVAAIDITGATTHVWNTSTGAPLAEVHARVAGFYSVAFSADGQFLATGGGEEVHVVDTTTWNSVQTIPGPGIHSLSWDARHTRLLTGSTSGAVTIWSIPGGQQIRLRDVGDPIDAVAFAPNGAMVVAANHDGMEQVWNAASGALQSHGSPLHGEILSIEFDPSSQLVVAAGANGLVGVTDAMQSASIAVLEGSRSAVLGARFAPDSKRVIGASGSSTWVWDAASPYRRWTTPLSNDECGYITSLEPDRRFVAVGCEGRTTKVWDTDRNELIAELPPVTEAGRDFASAFPAISSSGDRAAIAHEDTVLVYELPSGRLLRTVKHPAAISAVVFASNSTDLISGATDGSLLVTRDNGAQISIPSPADAGGVDAVAMLTDGRLVAAYQLKKLRIYNVQGNVLTSLFTRARVHTFRLSQDSRRLVTIPSVTERLAPPELWDLEHDLPLGSLATDTSEQTRVYSARFTADGSFLVACNDGAVRRWDGVTGQLLQTYDGSSRVLVDVTASPDGSMVIAGGMDGALHFWDTHSGRALWTMPAHRSAIVGIRADGDELVTRDFAGEISRTKLPTSVAAFAACSRNEHCAIFIK